MNSTLFLKKPESNVRRYFLTAAVLGTAFVAVVPISISRADTITKYQFVADSVKSGGGTVMPIPGSICNITSAGAMSAATSTHIDYTAWDLPTRTRVTTLYQGTIGPTGNNFTVDTSATTTETDLTLDFGSTSSAYTVGLFCSADSSSSSNNLYVKNRNFRVKYAGIADVSPTELIYSNIVNNSTLTSLPSTTDVNSSTPGIGFRGFTTPFHSYNQINQVYLSLQQPNGQFWDGSAWTQYHTNIQASRHVTNTTTGRTEWSKVGGWPTGSNLPNGVYKLRTMAVEGSTAGVGPGTLNTIQFTIGSSTPSDTVAPNPSNLTSPVSGSTNQYWLGLSGTSSDNTGGSGVARVSVHFLYEGSPLKEWNWVTQTWSTGYQAIPQSFKDAPLYNGGTAWSIPASFLPTGANIFQGNYTVRTYTYDNAGNGGTYAAQGFTISSSALRAATAGAATSPQVQPTPLPSPQVPKAPSGNSF